MHRTCTNTSIKPDRRKWMTRREKQWRRILSTSLLDATVPSDEVSSNSDCENRTVIKIEKSWKRHAGTWLSRLPLTKMEISAGTSSWPSRISHFTGSFVGHSPSEMLCPPAWKLKINHEESNQTSSAPKSTERSFTSIQMVHTHTLPQEGGKLRSRQWDENEEEGKWRWGEDDNEMKDT